MTHSYCDRRTYFTIANSVIYYTAWPKTMFNNYGAKHELMDVVSDLDRREDGRDVVCWTPSVLQDVKADTTVSIHCHAHNHNQ